MIVISYMHIREPLTYVHQHHYSLPLGVSSAVFLPQGIMGLSVISDTGVSWSYSLAVLLLLVCLFSVFLNTEFGINGSKSSF